MVTKKKEVEKKKEGDKKEEKVKKLTLFDHEIVPVHRALTEEEMIKLFSKYNITKLNLPKISKRDPCIKLIKAKPGDVIEITRNSKTAGISKYYRVVVLD
jgi:DNA-directed RNA polymerase subunit H